MLIGPHSPLHHRHQDRPRHWGHYRSDPRGVSVPPRRVYRFLRMKDYVLDDEREQETPGLLAAASVRRGLQVG